MNARALAIAICQATGLDINTVTGLRIEIEMVRSDVYATLEVKQRAPDSLAEVFKRFRIGIEGI